MQQLFEIGTNDAFGFLYYIYSITIIRFISNNACDWYTI